MKITGVGAVLYEYDLDRPLGDVHLPQGFRRGADLAVSVTTDEGVTGVTIAPAAAAGPLPLLESVVVGEDPRSVRTLWERMTAVAFKAGVAGPIKAAISGIDCALWDLRAKAHGVPLWRELGASHGNVPAYASGLDTPLSDDELAAFYRRMAGFGIRAGKLKVGPDREADRRRLGVVASSMSQLMIDANEFWSPKQAVQRVADLETEFELTWVEEPARRWDWEGLRRVSDAIRAPVASGENLDDVHDFVPLLRHGAVDVVQISSHTTGITGALQVGELAAAFDRPVAMMNCPGRFMAHLAAALPHHTMMEVLDAGRDAVLVRQPPLRDGRIVLGEEPGSGIEFDAEKLERHRVSAPSPHSFAALYRRDPATGKL